MGEFGSRQPRGKAAMAEKKISDYLPKTEILGQLTEELAEASAAASKLLVWLLRDHPIALAATTAFMIWMLAVALIYKIGGAP